MPNQNTDFRLRLPLCLLLILLSAPFDLGWSFVNVQTSTSMGLLRDYQQKAHFPIFHSWSFKGIHGGGLETSLDFNLSNDFSVNEWKVSPTQAQILVPFGSAIKDQPKNELVMGRQLFAEGFDLAILDGVKTSLWWSPQGGALPVVGYLRSTDFTQPEDRNTPLAGLVLWQRLDGLLLRGGYLARDEQLTYRYVFASGSYQFENLPWSPSLFLKAEWKAPTMTFNQAHYELMFHIAQALDANLSYSNLEPRPTSTIDSQDYVYRLFAATPTETVSGDVSWTPSDRLELKFGSEHGLYQSQLRQESSDRHDLSVQYEFQSGRWVSSSLTYLKSYGGEITDLGLAYLHDFSAISRATLEFDGAYLSKINQIQGWAQHLRTSYETHFWDRAKVIVSLEAERNHYYVFDVRAMAYVTNYL